MLIDSHSHLHFHKDFPDWQEVLQRAEAAGVTRQVLIGCEMRDSERAANFVQDKPGLDWVAGIHPHESHEITEENLRRLGEMIRLEGEFAAWAKRPVAVGEIGLDYFRSPHAPAIQQSGFRRQLELALDSALPVVVHIRDAFEDAAAILRESGVKRVVLHCFSGGLEQADWAWSHGFLTSFTGIVTYPKNTVLMDVVRRAPSHLYMLETDCPFLAPQVHRGRRNEPAYVREIAEHVARLRSESLETVAAQTTANARAFFGLGD
jgi:TatD DNase family protein